jgi:hypothetical protein
VSETRFVRNAWPLLLPLLYCEFVVSREVRG